MALTDRVRIVSIPEGCGGTLTAATIEGLTPARLAAYNHIEHNKARVIAEAKEAREIGVIGRPLMDLLLSRITEIGKDKLKTSSHPQYQSMILPYSYRTRKARIGNAQFAIVSGQANTNAGTTVGGVVYPDSAWDIVVNRGPGRVSDVPDLHRYFLPGTFVYVESINVGTGAKTVTPLKVVTSGTVGGVTTVTLAANRTDTWWGTAIADEKAPYQPTAGVVFRGNNDVNGYESWCYNEPTNLSKSLIVDWHQSSRYTQCYTEVYEKTLAAILSGQVNEMVKHYDYLSVAEQNAQMRKHFEEKWFNDIFYGDIIDERQGSPDNYTTLPPVTDVEDPTIVYGYKTRAKGLRTLLAEDSRVIDFAGGPLDIDLLIENVYEIYRNRGADGSTIDVVDIMTDRQTASLLRIAFYKIQEATYGENRTQFYKTGQVLDGVRTLFKYERYQLPTLPCDIAVFSSEFHDDRVSSFGDGSGGLQGSVNLRNSGRSMWLIDWTDFQIGIVSTDSARREYGGKVTADARREYSCVLKLNPKKIDLRETRWTAMLSDSARSLMIENYSLANPTYTLTPGSDIVYS